MVKDHVTVKDVAEILNIYEESAQELLDGIIPFEEGELEVLAQHLGISVEELVN